MERDMSDNPLLGERFSDDSHAGTGRMTIKGTINRLAMLLAMTVITAAWTWQRFTVDPSEAMLWAIGGALTGTVMVFALMFKRELAPYLAPAYALAEGLFIGAISARYDAQFGGIVFQAVMLTFGIMFAMLGAYSTGLIRATPMLVKTVVMATLGIAVFYIIAMVMMLFGAEPPLIYNSGPIGIAFSLIVIGIAAFNLIIDFDTIENGANMGMPKYMEWYGAFAMLVTLVWLYVEALRLISKLRD
ncbi:Bax inhibitor-1/YccA family protein [Moraxellaceae bacterium AER2_44_116]|nr:Bax inhibitor-1/YccA family protein [Moraxellaceae bacterium AER2_44_116]